MTLHYARSESAVKSAVRAAVRSRGVPVDLASADELAADLWATMTDQRATLAARESQLIGQYFPDMIRANRRFYPLTATESATRTAAGLGPHPRGVLVDDLDPVTRELARTKVLPYLDPDSEDVIARFVEELAATASRHVKSASRDLVTDTARLNRAGWARQLTGGESCTFCAMLVSRGAVYTEKSVNFQTHNHCDCTATLVRNPGDDYPGKSAAIQLNGLYREARGNMAEFRKLITDEVGDYEKLAA